MPPHPPDPLSGPPLTRLRLARGWSQSRLAAELCAAAGVPTLSRHEISRWERRRRTPGRYWHAWLAIVLGVPTRPPLGSSGTSPTRPSAGKTVLTDGDATCPKNDRDRRVGRCRPASPRPPTRLTGRSATRRNVGGSARGDLTY
ncbi:MULTISPECIES: helix-turn-helix domain-containing protein [Micromonospora]|uniref:helix-turn-helix domain-containing protein n=1 Tax=Micromonospora TaxID=1873 RepID=UPI001EE39881|nr:MULTISPECIES: helix-turn-helix transcriptional regulator [Micromonospora]WSK41838.1 helix-turn-helix domain-containing protein [Micromonospora maris]